MMSWSILCMLSSGQWGGLLWPSVPGGWPAAGTLQGGLQPPERPVGAAGQNLPRQQCVRGGSLWYCYRCVFVYASLCFHCVPLYYKAFQLLHTFNAVFSSLKLFFCFLQWFTPCWIFAVLSPTWTWHCMQTHGNSSSSQYICHVVCHTRWTTWL